MYGFTLLSENEITARKPHTCDWCFTKIPVGEKYVKFVYIYDGFTRESFHPECYAAMNTTASISDSEERCTCKHKRGEVCNA